MSTKKRHQPPQPPPNPPFRRNSSPWNWTPPTSVTNASWSESCDHGWNGRSPLGMPYFCWVGREPYEQKSPFGGQGCGWNTHWFHSFGIWTCHLRLIFSVASRFFWGGRFLLVSDPETLFWNISFERNTLIYQGLGWSCGLTAPILGECIFRPTSQILNFFWLFWACNSY